MRKTHYVRNSTKVIIVLGVSFLLVAVEGWLEGKVAISGLLAVVSMACVLKIEKYCFCVKTFVRKTLGSCGFAAEVMLFVLVGAAVDIRYTLKAGFAAILMIFIALLFRACGVLLCTAKTNLNLERTHFFRVIAYLPKATVQAAIGSVPLASGLACGKSCSVSSGHGNYSYSSARSFWNGSYLQKMAAYQRKSLDFLW